MMKYEPSAEASILHRRVEGEQQDPGMANPSGKGPESK